MESFKHRNTAEQILRAKKKHRTEVDPLSWGKFKYSERNICNELLEVPFHTPIDSIDFKNQEDVQTFYTKYSRKYRPCIIKNAIDEWPCVKDSSLWDPREGLDKRLRHELVKVGEDDDGRKIRIKYKYFKDYLSTQDDDSPLYLFEVGLDSSSQMATLQRDYKVNDNF